MHLERGSSVGSRRRYEVLAEDAAGEIGIAGHSGEDAGRVDQGRAAKLIEVQTVADRYGDRIGLLMAGVEGSEINPRGSDPS